jgi:uncharacterized repeat protein (TIGR03803 family)
LNSPPGHGTVFQLTPPAQPGGAWSESVLYAFTGGSDGDEPTFGPTLDSAGNVYGTTLGGGSAGLGTIFELSPEGQETTLHSFARTDGVSPSGLLRDSRGNLYGTAQAGGTANAGTVFKLTPARNGLLTLRAVPTSHLICEMGCSFARVSAPQMMTVEIRL